MLLTLHPVSAHNFEHKIKRNGSFENVAPTVGPLNVHCLQDSVLLPVGVPDEAFTPAGALPRSSRLHFCTCLSGWMVWRPTHQPPIPEEPHLQVDTFPH